MSRSNEERFNEKEVGKLLRRAAERQQAEQAKQANQGLNIEEVEQLASDIGIDPKFVSLALLDFKAGQEDVVKNSTLLGGPVEINLERIVPGRLSDDTIARMLSEIRKTYPITRGHFENIGGHFSWTPGSASYPSGKPPLISISPEGENTRIRIYENTKAMYWLYLIPFYFYLMGGGLLFTDAPLTVPLTFLVFGVLVPIMIYYATRSSSRKRHEKHTGLMESLQDIAEAAAPASVEEMEPASGAQRIDHALLEEDDEKDEAESISKHREKSH